MIIIFKGKLVFWYMLLGIFLILAFVLAVIHDSDEEEIIQGSNIEFESGQIIELLRHEDGQIESIDLNYYLLCVVASEMPFKYEYEAIKAQTVVARTYLYNKIINNLEEGADVCDDSSHCQAFYDIEYLEEVWRQKGYTDEEILEGEEKIKNAIIETQGQIITYEGQIIEAYFHASSPICTEDASAIWGNRDIEYLKSVENIEDEDYEYRTSQKEVSYATFKNTLIDGGYIEDLSLDEFLSVSINEYTSSGRVKNISVGTSYIKAETLRTLFGLNSTNFTIDVTKDSITFNVLGYGHGVGLSQVGANTYAKSGASYDEIIYHYYTGVTIENLN